MFLTLQDGFVKDVCYYAHLNQQIIIKVLDAFIPRKRILVKLHT